MFGWEEKLINNFHFDTECILPVCNRSVFSVASAASFGETKGPGSKNSPKWTRRPRRWKLQILVSIKTFHKMTNTTLNCYLHSFILSKFRDQWRTNSGRGKHNLRDWRWRALYGSSRKLQLCWTRWRYLHGRLHSGQRRIPSVRYSFTEQQFRTAHHWRTGRSSS